MERNPTRGELDGYDLNARRPFVLESANLLEILRHRATRKGKLRSGRTRNRLYRRTIQIADLTAYRE
jgi:hypothetical protein